MCFSMSCPTLKGYSSDNTSVFQKQSSEDRDCSRSRQGVVERARGSLTLAGNKFCQANTDQSYASGRSHTRVRIFPVRDGSGNVSNSSCCGQQPLVKKVYIVCHVVLHRSLVQFCQLFCFLLQVSELKTGKAKERE